MSDCSEEKAVRTSAAFGSVPSRSFSVKLPVRESLPQIGLGLSGDLTQHSFPNGQLDQLGVTGETESFHDAVFVEGNGSGSHI